MRHTVDLYYVALTCEPGGAAVYTMASPWVLGLPILSLAPFTRRYLPGFKYSTVLVLVSRESETYKYAP
jgi:hypothetical protein